MDIGTAKPDRATLAQFPHHLIDLITPEEAYSAARFRADALRVMGEITARGKIPLLAGGTMLYFKALREGLSDLPQADAGLRREIDAEARGAAGRRCTPSWRGSTPKRRRASSPPTRSASSARSKWCASPARRWPSLARRRKPPLPYRPHSARPAALRPRRAACAHRAALRRHAGRRPHRRGDRAAPKKYRLHAGLPSMRCVGYRQVWDCLEGTIDRAALREKGIAATRQLAKRQLTWLRSWPETVEAFDCLAA
jgi:tRNA dimethylallyltransferase